MFVATTRGLKSYRSVIGAGRHGQLDEPRRLLHHRSPCAVLLPPCSLCRHVCGHGAQEVCDTDGRVRTRSASRGIFCAVKRGFGSQAGEGADLVDVQASPEGIKV